jgi:hypothetical protein
MSKAQKFEDAVSDLIAEALADGVSRDEIISALEVVKMTTEEADDIITD